MKKISVYIFLIFFIFVERISADDITDFQIEGMSVEDSLFDYFTKQTAKKLSKYIEEYSYKDWSFFDKPEGMGYEEGIKTKKKENVKLFGLHISNTAYKLNTYDTVQVVYSDDMSTIKVITGIKYFENKYKICKKI